MDNEERGKERKERLIQLLLFVVTIFTTTFAGIEWIYGRSLLLGSNINGDDIIGGLNFSIPFLLILTIHEFGHYLTARFYKIKTSLPFFLPFIPGFLSIGTFGAVIRIREKVRSNIEHFDIGIAGPLAGFVAALFVLVRGFTTLPEKDYVLDIHPEYAYFGDDWESIVYDVDTTILKSDLEKISSSRTLEDYPDTLRMSSTTPSLSLGNNLTFMFFESYVANAERVPDHREMMHYPWLLAGFLALFFTALNLLPIGQLDGGHVIYGLFGERQHARISSAIFVLFIAYAGIGIVDPNVDPLDELLIKVPLYVGFLYITFLKMIPNVKDRLLMSVSILAVQYFVKFFFPEAVGFNGWLLFAFLIGRFLGIYHPRSPIEKPLDQGRTILGWIALIVFIISFSPRPILFE